MPADRVETVAAAPPTAVAAATSSAVRARDGGNWVSSGPASTTTGTRGSGAGRGRRSADWISARPELGRRVALGGFGPTGALDHRGQRPEIGRHRQQLVDPVHEGGDGGVGGERHRCR